MANLKNNKRERIVYEKYTKIGYNCLTKGYPDFCFYNDNDVLFIEVKKALKKPTRKMGLSKHQKTMIDIFKRLDLNVKVEYID